jgi:hypothetical protein
MTSYYAIQACKTILWWVKNQTDVNTHLLALNSKPSSFAGASLMAYTEAEFKANNKYGW